MGTWEWPNNSWTDNTTLNQTITYTGSGSPITVYPAMVAISNSPEPEKKSNNPLDWLREQVNEICELALAI